jgi:hypothetical protein
MHDYRRGITGRNTDEDVQSNTEQGSVTKQITEDH